MYALHVREHHCRIHTIVREHIHNVREHICSKCVCMRCMLENIIAEYIRLLENIYIMLIHNVREHLSKCVKRK